MCLTFSINIHYIVHCCTWNAVESLLFVTFLSRLHNVNVTFFFFNFEESVTGRSFFMYLMFCACTKYNHIIVSLLDVET